MSDPWVREGPWPDRGTGVGATGPAGSTSPTPPAGEPPGDPPVRRRRHDPYWDLDGAGCTPPGPSTGSSGSRPGSPSCWYWLRRDPTAELDPEYLIHGEGRPVLAAALFGLAGSAAVLALARIRHASHQG